MEPLRATRATTKRLPAKRTTRNSDKTPTYIYTPIGSHQRHSSSATPGSASSRKSPSSASSRKSPSSASSRRSQVSCTSTAPAKRGRKPNASVPARPVPAPVKSNDDREDDDVIESSQDATNNTPPTPPTGDDDCSAQFVIERDTCQMSPLLFDDSDTDAEANAAASLAETAATSIPNNQQQQKNMPSTEPKEELLDLSSASSSGPLLELPTSTTETDTDLSQPQRTTAAANNKHSGSWAASQQLLRRRSSFRAFKCTPARLTRLSALRDCTQQPAATTSTAATARMAPPAPTKRSAAQRPNAYPSSSSEFSVASDISAIMSARRNVITGESDELLPANSLAPAEPPFRTLPCSADLATQAANRQLNRLRSASREPSTSQELQILEPPQNVIITLSSSADDSQPLAASEKAATAAAASKHHTPRFSFFGPLTPRHRSPDLFDTYDDNDGVPLPPLPRRPQSLFFDRPRPSFFARLRQQAAAATAASEQQQRERERSARQASVALRHSTPLTAAAAAGCGGSKRSRKALSAAASASAREQQRRDDSMDIFGDNATFIETHRPAQLADETLVAEAEVVAEERDEQRHRKQQQEQQQQQLDGNNSTTYASVFEITKNDVFPHLIRLHSDDSDMSPIKMSEDEQQHQKQPKNPKSGSPATPQNARLREANNNHIRAAADLENTASSGVIPSSQLEAAGQRTDEEQRTPHKLTLYERLCRSDPSRQFGSARRRKMQSRMAAAAATTGAASGAAPALSQSVIRTPIRRRRKSIAAAVAGLEAGAATGSVSPAAKKRGRPPLQKWGSGETGATQSKLRQPWTGRRLDDYFAKASTTAATTTTTTTSVPGSTASKKTNAAAEPSKAKASARFPPLMVLSSDEDGR